MIFHVDVNSAYLSWTSVQRIAQGKTDLRDVAACIAGDPSKRTSIVLAKSIKAKEFGIKTGEPISMALQKCPDLQIDKPDFQQYCRCSDAFMNICRRFAPVLEKYSIDECFLDMTGTQHLYPDPVKTAFEIKDAIKKELGFTVNVGIGSNKLLAKMASDLEKPDKVHTLFTRQLGEKIWPLPVGELFSVGAATAQKLNRAGIYTIRDLAVHEEQTIMALLGKKHGRRVWRYANGLDDSPVEAQPPKAKGLSVTTTLEENITDRRQASQIFLILAESVTARMREEGAKAGCAAVMIRTKDFVDSSHQIHFDTPTDVTNQIFQTVMRLFDEHWDQKTPLRQLGISLNDLHRGEEEQLSLFSSDSGKKDRELDKTVDEIRRRFGSEIIKRGSTFQVEKSVAKRYSARRELLQKEKEEP